MNTQKVELPKLSGKGCEWWKSLDIAERKRLMYPRFEAECSNSHISKEFGLKDKPGIVAGMRDRYRKALHPERYIKGEDGRHEAVKPEYKIVSRKSNVRRSQKTKTKSPAKPKRQAGGEFETTPVPRDKVKDFIDSVVVPPITFDNSPEALAPHLFRPTSKYPSVKKGDGF